MVHGQREPNDWKKQAIEMRIERMSVPSLSPLSTDNLGTVSAHTPAFFGSAGVDRSQVKASYAGSKEPPRIAFPLSHDANEVDKCKERPPRRACSVIPRLRFAFVPTDRM